MEGYTSCGGLRSGTGFMAFGAQNGIALGFWGIGFSIFLPPVSAYGLFGYALYASVSAEHIEPWPPNYPPEITILSPLDGAENVSISTSELTFKIKDDNDDLMNYTVTTDPDVGSGSGSSKLGGTYSVPIIGLEGTEEYTWYIQVDDGEKVVNVSSSFTTEAVAPVVSNPSPGSQGKNILLDLSHLSFYLNDPQGDLMDYSVETVPDIGSGIGSNVDEGRYIVDINSPLGYSQEYAWFVNVTDGENWKHKMFTFTTRPIPGSWWNSNWMYRKEIIVNYSMVKGDLNNFPVLISLDSDSNLAYHTQDDGDDIVFTDYYGVKLNHEIEIFNGDNGDLTAWVNIPNLKTDTILYMYYGNINCSNQQSIGETWNNNFIAVYHMNDINDGVSDSTIYCRDSNGSEGNPGYQQTGISGFAVDFNGDDDLIYLPHNFNLGTSDITLEVWINAKSWSDYGEASCALSFVGEHYLRSANYRNKYGEDVLRGFGYCIEPSGSWNNLVLQYNPPTNSWIYIAGSYDNDIGGEAYYNSLLKDVSSQKGNLRNRSVTNRIGYYFNGLIDEVRVSNIKRSDGWVKTTYNSIKESTSFLSIGPEETE
jgi:hypothetical protein